MMLIFFTTLLQIAILVSAINRSTASLSILISLFSIFFGLLYFVKQKQKIKIPPNFYFMIIFNVILYLYLLFISNKENPLYYALMFATSLFYWLIFYNLERGSKVLKLVILSTALIASGIFVISKLINPNVINFSELFFINNLGGKHYFIGNIWAFVIVMIFGESAKNFDLRKLVLIGIGFIFLAVSNSRSALVSLMPGILHSNNLLNKNKHAKTFFILVGVILLSIFVSSSINKTILFSRPYFTQSIESFVKYPLGIGMGNFEQISLEYYEKSKDLSIFSIYTHNIFLESLSGVGIFSILFFIFIFKSAKEIVKSNERRSMWGIVFLSITVSFMLDTSYTLPGLMWIWFIVYGVHQKKMNNPD